MRPFHSQMTNTIITAPSAVMPVDSQKIGFSIDRACRKCDEKVKHVAGWPLGEKKEANPSDKEDSITGNEEVVQAKIIGNVVKAMRKAFEALGLCIANSQVGNTNDT